MNSIEKEMQIIDLQWLMLDVFDDTYEKIKKYLPLPSLMDSAKKDLQAR